MATYTAVERWGESSLGVRLERDPKSFTRRLPVSLTTYVMRGKHAVHGWINWIVYGTPDTTGALSGYPGALTSITYTTPLYNVT